MNGLAVAGAVGGLMQGLEFARRTRANELAEAKLGAAEQREKEQMDLRRKELAQQEKYQGGLLDIYRDREINDQQQAKAKTAIEQAQMNETVRHNKASETNTAEDNRRQAGLGLAQQDYYRAQVANLQADNALAAAQQREKERQQRQIEAAQKLPAYTPILQDPKADIPADFIDTFRAATYGVSPLVYAGPEGKEIVDTYEGVRTGKIPLDDPRVIRAVALTHPEILERGIGDPVDRSGVKGQVTGKRGARIVPMDDGQGGKKYAVMLNVDWQDAAGKPQAPYEAPLTEFGTTDPNDPVLLIGPEHFDERAAEALYASHKFGKPEVRARLLKAVEGAGEKQGKEEDPEKRAADLDKTRAQTRKANAEADLAESIIEKGEKPSDNKAGAAPGAKKDFSRYWK